MITIESKLEKFRETILGKVEKDAEYFRFQNSADEERMLAKRREELEQDASELAKKEAKKAEDEYLKIISDAKLFCSKKALEARQSMLKAVMDRLVELVKVFKSSQEYKSYVARQIESLPLEFSKLETLEVKCMDEDRIFIKDAFESLGFSGEILFEKLSERSIGGFVVKEKKYNSRFDMRLREMVEDSADLIGEKLYVLLEKAGE
ncbi:MULTISPECIES: V-type ATP synthase subunit E family protein [unclassified Fusibacter]|uniref:V-type ATP synthase subunit E family protein n=1 Tax=unclassified Fusibacter TaxID=2624464 RepID=UPI00101037CB|nr:MULTISPECIES: V-type ATP synthase subunit E family protein [unclassified Fusibacter]MCK8059890.1 V-type ATP synthase subunit E family protein [Fusibacter sp. A2]NPE21692.1 hypothetical protein [Fusibacter sp. A1]RXV62095.1 hypothetical protein DWB64_07595 [Fusibacter sp. A1]